MLPAFSGLRLTLGFTLLLTGLLVLINAPLRRFSLGPFDRYNRDLFVTGGYRVARDGRLPDARAARGISSYFLWLIYVSIVSFAGVYCVISSEIPGSFEPAIKGLPEAVLLSISTVSTVSIVPPAPVTLLAQIALALQVLTGPLLFAWLVSELLSINPVGAPLPRPSASAKLESLDIQLVGAMFVRAGTALLALRSQSSDFRPGLWDLIGGHVEPGEPLVAALRREVFEEIGIDSLVIDFTPVARWIECEIDLSIWVIREWTGEPRNCVPGSHDQIAWWGIGDIPSIQLGDERYVRLLLNELRLDQTHASE